MHYSSKGQRNLQGRETRIKGDGLNDESRRSRVKSRMKKSTKTLLGNNEKECAMKNEVQWKK